MTNNLIKEMEGKEEHSKQEQSNHQNNAKLDTYLDAKRKHNALADSISPRLTYLYKTMHARIAAGFARWKMTHGSDTSGCLREAYLHHHHRRTLKYAICSFFISIKLLYLPFSIKNPQSALLHEAPD